MKKESQAGSGPGSGPEPAASPSPLTPVTTIVDLLCPSLLVNPTTSQPTRDVINARSSSNKSEKSLVLLYFSAHWCPPCQAFTPKLRAFYKATKQQQQLEIVYVGSDRTLAEFNEYFGSSMPWVAVGAADDASVQAKNRLAQALQIRSIPTLVVFRREKPGVDSWLYVTNRARDQVNTLGAASPESLVKEWLEMPAVPLAEAASLEAGGSTGGAFNTLKEIVMTVLRNPMYLFALIYLVKYVMRTHVSKEVAQGIDQDPFGAADASSEDAGESEF
jgi:thioredoxin-like negative regulator of GroEL